MEDKMKKHVTLVAAIQIAFSVVGLIGALFMFFIFSFARTQVGDDETARKVLQIFAILVPLVVGALSAAGFAGGVGLFTYRPWARYLVMVIAALGCLNIPFGTAKGIYALWVLLQSDTIKLFNIEQVSTLQTQG